MPKGFVDRSSDAQVGVLDLLVAELPELPKGLSS